MKKLITNLLLLLAIISIASAASVSTDSANYDVGDTIDITVSDCSTGSTVTLNIQGFWADQGISDSSNEYSSSYTIPTGFNSGTYTLNANCGGTPISENFCVNPGCSTGESSESSEDSRQSTSGGGGGSSGGLNIAEEEMTPEPEPEPAPEVEDEPEELPTYFADEESSEEDGSTMTYILIAVAALLVILGGIMLWRKSKKPTGYVPMNQMPQNPTQ